MSLHNHHEHIQKEIGLAVKHTWAISQTELFQLLEIDENAFNPNIDFDKLLFICHHPDVRAMDLDTRLAIIRAAQIAIGKLVTDREGNE